MTPVTGYVVMVYGSDFLNARRKALAFASVEVVNVVRDQASDLVYLQTVLLATKVRQAARQLEETL